MTNIPHLIHQGDVALIEVARSAGATTVALTQTPDGHPEAVLALGETSGHRHTIISDRMTRFRDDGCGYGVGVTVITLDEPATLCHLHGASWTGEHNDVALRATSYAVLPQAEWSDAHEPRRVAD